MVEQPPGHILSGVAEVEEIANAVGSVIITDAVTETLLLSVTVTVYVPATSPLAVSEVPPVGAQLYV